MAKAGAGGGAESSVADRLRELGVKGVLVRMAERGQLLDLKCEMPQCYLVPENVRLSHTECNQRDYNRRKQIGTLLAKGKSLAEIAETLNRKGVPPAHGTNRWTAAMVRKAYVS